MLILYFLISLVASITGAICGIGGGVIIKPTLDFFQLSSVATINFLSGCTVLSMSLYTVIKNFISGESIIKLDIITPLAIGASIGGVLGKELFSYISNNAGSIEIIGAYQSAILAIITFGTLIYTIFKQRINTHNVESKIYGSIIGLVLGIISSFLGIGGGPINIIMLYFFFSMDTKQASQNSLYVILFSQLTSFISTLITRSIPSFSYGSLILMVVGGIMGGVIGRKLYRKMDNKVIEQLFTILIIVIIIISIYNSYQYYISVN
jgi:hypothetical protein